MAICNPERRYIVMPGLKDLLTLCSGIFDLGSGEAAGRCVAC